MTTIYPLLQWGRLLTSRPPTEFGVYFVMGGVRHARGVPLDMTPSEERTMRKQDEISDPTSCLNRASDDEILFVLRAKDEAMAATIRFWIGERIRLGLNVITDAKIISAQATIEKLEAEQT